MKASLRIFLLVVFLQSGSFAQDTTAAKPAVLLAGLRFQKAVGFYWSNGLSVEYSSRQLCRQKISLGFNFVSNLFGSAIGSNAIPYAEMDLSVLKYFRKEKPIKTLVRVNLGYARAALDPEFSGLPDRSFIASIEGGAAYDLKYPVRIALTGGYNIITGNGMKGLGVLFPVYAQCSVFYRIPSKVTNLPR